MFLGEAPRNVREKRRQEKDWSARFIALQGGVLRAPMDGIARIARLASALLE